ncbi:hypothetical protein NEOLI_005087 [Neolecta irregularis DAH-3]|uniref:Uncharacterized protein n=1 Tax=Neolecta irregularis (strain DAH-3) TaxID=1198029 RepID=A0A1U7LM89_NEOID|nr:hypothetical protein NEOLI_005087 [Neolecta irregularis DAH-3]|eukprot:OLL23662.1 hypothetical protein NEOLI_005087 [Neolecta irregularis DAH-3]
MKFFVLAVFPLIVCALNFYLDTLYPDNNGRGSRLGLESANFAGEPEFDRLSEGPSCPATFTIVGGSLVATACQDKWIASWSEIPSHDAWELVFQRKPWPKTFPGFEIKKENPLGDYYLYFDQSNAFVTCTGTVFRAKGKGDLEENCFSVKVRVSHV